MRLTIQPGSLQVKVRAIATEEVLGGTAIGTLIGLFLGRDRIDLIVVNPDTDLDLRLNSDLRLPNK